MQTTSLFIPKRIKVGFQHRKDTYTEKLGYVIYYDEKGKLRKEASWESWRSKDIDPVEYDNVPTSGFTLNKKVGGYVNHWSNFRNAYVRVYDPRGFEFEISVQNLLYILENTSSIKGKGLEGEFVYCWDGPDLVLIPTSSPDYAQLVSLNEKRFNGKIAAKDLIVGATYLTKNNLEVVYLGRFDYYSKYSYLFDGRAFSTFISMCNYAEKNKKIISDQIPDRSGYYDYGESYNYLYSKKKYYNIGFGLVGKMHFFSIKQSPHRIERKSSLSGWLIDVVSEECDEQFPERMEILDCSGMTSPVDESKRKLVEYTEEEFRKILKNPYIHREFAAVVGEGSCEGIVVFNISGNNYGKRAENDWRYDVGIIRDYTTDEVVCSVESFGLSGDSSVDELFNTFKFVHVDEYLENGKFYERR